MTPEKFSSIIPWGGGGLTSGIASAVKALRPGTRIVTAEPETAAPLAAAFHAGGLTEIEFRPSFVDGAGGRSVEGNRSKSGKNAKSAKAQSKSNTAAKKPAACP